MYLLTTKIFKHKLVHMGFTNYYQNIICGELTVKLTRVGVENKFDSSKGSKSGVRL